MSSCAYRNIRRAPADDIRSLARAGVATVHEAMGRHGLLRPAIRPVWPGASAAGTAVTALCPPGDNWMLHVAIELMQPGDMLVVATTSPSTDGYFGDLLAEYTRHRGGVGVVTDTGCRDIATLAEMGFPVWSRAVCGQGTVKETPGAVNVPVVCGGVAITPGDVVIGDDDGVVVVPRGKTRETIAAAQARMAREAGFRERIRAGEATLDIFDIRDKLAKRGFRYHDTPPRDAPGRDETG